MCGIAEYLSRVSTSPDSYYPSRRKDSLIPAAYGSRTTYAVIVPGSSNTGNDSMLINNTVSLSAVHWSVGGTASVWRLQTEAWRPRRDPRGRGGSCLTLSARFYQRLALRQRQGLHDPCVAAEVLDVKGILRAGIGEPLKGEPRGIRLQERSCRCWRTS